MEKKILKIGQISDIHIGEDESLVQGIDVRANFMQALNSQSMKDLDLLVLSGDLANEDAEPGAYKWIADVLKDYPVPYCVIPGNHDRIEVMEKFYDLRGKIHNGKCYYRYDIAGRSVFFLDSACGEVSSDQLVWLKEEAAKVSGEILLFVHHPPCFCGHRFMDLRYHMRNMLEVQQVLEGIPNLTHIFTGHYHSNFDVKVGRQTVHVAPATQMQIDPNCPYFNLQSSAPGWQVIKWGENFVETEVNFH
ncbi:MAG: metallophosphoesterase [Fibrobacter sp.]|nr:metallophosphoesterase [Fibrobacter sp.]